MVSARTNARVEEPNYSSRQTTVVEDYFTDRTVRKEIQPLIEDIAPHRLAKASGCTIDAAKMWLSGNRTPSTASVFNMARAIPRIAMWLSEHGNHQESRLISELKRTAMLEGPEAAFARRILRENGIT